MTFTDRLTSGKQRLMACNPESALPSCWKAQGIGGNVPLYEYDGACTVVHAGLPETEPETYE